MRTRTIISLVFLALFSLSSFEGNAQVGHNKPTPKSSAGSSEKSQADQTQKGKEKKKAETQRKKESGDSKKKG